MVRVKRLLAGTRAAAACGQSGALCFPRIKAARELAALKHLAPVPLIHCDARHALRLGRQIKIQLQLQLQRRPITVAATLVALAVLPGSVVYWGAWRGGFLLEVLADGIGQAGVGEFAHVGSAQSAVGVVEEG